MRSKSGFTIVELAVVITVIVILSSISVLTYSQIRKEARDTTRSSKATTLSESLEKYYEKNGEYPPVPSLVNNSGISGQNVVDKLGIALNDLKMPSLPSSVTNPITSTVPPVNDNIAYIASSDADNTQCQSNAAGGCDQFTLQYTTEAGPTVSIESRHRGRSSSVGSSSGDTPPTLTLTTTPPNVIATIATSTACSPATLTPKFAYSYRTKGGNDAGWSSWSNYSDSWTSSRSFSLVGVPGTTYAFTAYSRCDDGATAGASTLVGPEQTILYPINPPSVPSITTVLNANNTVTFTISTVTCTGGATPQYSYRYHNITTTTYPAWSTFGSARAWSHTPIQSYSYFYEPQARCHMTNADSAGVIGSEATYGPHPIDTPPAPSPTVTADGTGQTWNWTAPTCATGTYAQYQTRLSYDYPTDYGWNPPTVLTSRTWAYAGQGYQSNLEVQSRCRSTYADGAWSASGNASYLRPIDTPTAPTNFTGTLSGDRLTYNFAWTRPTCGTGTAAIGIHDTYVAPPTTWETTGLSGWYGWTGTEGYYTGVSIFHSNGSQISAGTQYQARAQFRCFNSVTGRGGSYGPIGVSALNTVP